MVELWPGKLQAMKTPGGTPGISMLSPLDLACIRRSRWLLLAPLPVLLLDWPLMITVINHTDPQ